MKKLLVGLCAIFICTFAIAHSIEWYVDGSLYQTTTCDAGDNITPPTAPAKYGYHFVEWEKNYTQLEYIESTGTQYIDIGRKVRSDYTYKTKVAWTQFGAYTFMSSKENSDWKVGRYLGIPYYGITGEKAWYSRKTSNPNPSTPTTVTVSVNNVYNFDWKPSSGNININGTVYNYASGSAQTTDLFETANNMYLFAANSAGVASGFDYVKMYGWQMYDTDGTTLLMNLVPAKNSSNVVGMYDTVSETFFTNAGTGEFIAGPEAGGL